MVRYERFGATGGLALRFLRKLPGGRPRNGPAAIACWRLRKRTKRLELMRDRARKSRVDHRVVRAGRPDSRFERDLHQGTLTYWPAVQVKSAAAGTPMRP